MPEITLNGRKLKAADGQTVLEVARQEGIYIPTLCYHPGLGYYGACRLCLVETKAGFRPGLTASCALSVVDGMVVETDNSAVKDGRRLVAELLLARAPESKEIRAIANSLGVQATSIPTKGELCVLCGRCVRACKALGINAISFVQRGAERRVAVPFDQPSEQCMACQACVTVCPTGAIHAKITPKDVEMVEWQTHQEMRECSVCRKPFVTERQQLRVDQLLKAEYNPRTGLCSRCRRRETANDVCSIPEVRYFHTHPPTPAYGKEDR